jgi:Acetyltransferase (GNAT) domain
MITQVVPTADSRWQQCLDNIPHDFYHLPGYLELEGNRHHATPEAIIIREEDKIFFLPYLVRDCTNLLEQNNFGANRTYDIISPYGYPGLLVNPAGEDQAFIKKCLSSIYQNWHQRNICSAFIRLHPLLNSCIDIIIEDQAPFVVSSQGDVVVCDLTKDINDIWQQTRTNHRRKISKLVRSGFTAQVKSLNEYFDVFIDIYQETMDRVNANNSYYFKRDYFRSLANILKDRLHVCVVEVAGEVVAASLITELNGIVQYHLGGTKTKFLQQSPATMMFDYMIKWSKQRENRYLNLGGGLGGNQDSLYHFKAGFSNQVRPFMTMKTIVNEDIYNRLTYLRAESLGINIPVAISTSFFPAYRSC